MQGTAEDAAAAAPTTEAHRKPGWLLVQAVTLSRVLNAVVFACVLLLPEMTPLTLGICVAVLALIEISDMSDGYLARRFGLVSEWGAMLDPYADSMSRLIVYWSLAMSGFVLPFLPLVMALRDITVSYCRVVLSGRGRTVSARWSGKAKAWVQGVAALVALLQPLYWDALGHWTATAISWVVAIATVVSVWSYASAVVLAAKGKPET